MNDRAFILTFLRELAANNHKAWMDQHRADYQQARLDFIALLRELLGGLQQFEPESRPPTCSTACTRTTVRSATRKSISATSARG